MQNPVGNVVCRIVLWLSTGNGDLGQNKEMVGSDRLSSDFSLFLSIYKLVKVFIFQPNINQPSFPVKFVPPIQDSFLKRTIVENDNATIAILINI